MPRPHPILGPPPYPRALLPVQPLGTRLPELLLSLRQHCVPEALAAVWGGLALDAMRAWLRRCPAEFAAGGPACLP